MSVQRDRPYPNANFLVDLGDGDPNTVQAGLIEVVLPDARVQVVEYRSGNDKSNDSHKLTTQTGYGNLILKRATHGSLTWYAWWNEVRNGDQAAFRTVVVQLLNEDHTQTVLTWKFLRARPVSHRFAPLVGHDNAALDRDARARVRASRNGIAALPAAGCRRVAEELVQERLHPAERVDPPAVQQRLVHVVRKDDELVVDVALCAAAARGPSSAGTPRCGRRRPGSAAPVTSSRRSRRSSRTCTTRDSGSSELPHRCTPARSTPALKMSELRASACDVSTPPYDRPQMPMRFGSTSGRVCRYLPPATTS